MPLYGALFCLLARVVKFRVTENKLVYSPGNRKHPDGTEGLHIHHAYVLFY